MKVRTLKVEPMLLNNNLDVWVTPSTSEEGTKYLTVFSADGTMGMCTCKGYKFNGYCWHVREIREKNYV